ncbi:MAG: hypothetical protein K2R98_00675 [Gemmataceae bacterium]|nr:hypothetical protein [Gemmataceae bacterium]
MKQWMLALAGLVLSASPSLAQTHEMLPGPAQQVFVTNWDVVFANYDRYLYIIIGLLAVNAMLIGLACSQLGAIRTALEKQGK